GYRPAIADAAAKQMPGLYQALSTQWWVDELYGKILLRPIALLSDLLFQLVDRAVIDASVNGTGMAVEASGDAAHRAHSGFLSHYLLLMYAGSVIFLVFWFLLS
ncbi:MAG: hypothetical protein IT290_04010, partial [Deltaproteobacteria bacterium]|nr:hypothetical protein [Deltaproteobacteria bacterium]